MTDPNVAWLLSETQVSTIEAAFQEFTERKDIAILLINQHVCWIHLRPFSTADLD